ncbi:Oligopeptide/dipeptide ABC transporter, ATPase subunit (plasmid) [Neorhizobium galegae bv. officinalis bv. officinalis str. HAMBI 1141]|uniref:Oligopeptide/dipeptide ABC transporter, ATPase subunit n=1 Tax=Neorhizobium galegae bv. officinalis bv. officinalis str. HAMBI 1141 TaxID=1028801 RepID=A0A068TIB1_NEOGA|nr:ABC transporter ATP-binding protein [Neorhizobium galegae]CDN58093.1 Oligopeptide/dipeptide ABC transporter, ATPase subunit [Neorhizobium galegae bv. officinalis bv. officinalis str. HAMBI 1141]
MTQIPVSAGNGHAHVLETSNLRAYYRMKYFGIDREVRAVDGISMHVRKHEIYGIAGESSCGKTTFIKAIAAAIRPPLEIVGGHVKYSFIDDDLYALPPARRAAIRWRHLSYILQGSMNVLNPVRRVHKTFEDFAFRHMHLPRAEFDQEVRRHLERLRLPPEILRSYPHELSGGMRQRVCIALATLCRPEFIIADEPTTALDVVVQKDVLAMIRETQHEFSSSMIFVTHDLTVHANITDRLGIMYAGRLVEEGRTADVFANPLHPYTAHLIASLPTIGDRHTRDGLHGTPPNLADPPKGCRFHPRCPLAMEICRHKNPALTTLAEDHRVACFAASSDVLPTPDEKPNQPEELETER